MSEKVTQLIEDVKALTVLELSELVKALEEEFGVFRCCSCSSCCCSCSRRRSSSWQKRKQNLMLF